MNKKSNLNNLKVMGWDHQDHQKKIQFNFNNKNKKILKNLKIKIKIL